MTVLTMPLIIFNLLGGLVGGIWLAFLGEWATIGRGLAGMFGGALLCSFLMFLGMMFQMPGIKMWESRKFFARIFAIPMLLIGHAWIYIVMTGWAIGAFQIIFRDVSGQSSVLPHGLWAYAVAVGPWSFLLQKDVDAGNDHGEIPVFFLQIACICLVLGTWLEIKGLVISFWAIMAVSLIVGSLNFIRLLYKEKPFLNADTGLAFSELDKAMSGQHGIAFTLIKPQIEQLLRHNKGTLVGTMRKRGICHEVIVLKAAKFILDDVLPSGNYHIYRGVLSQQGDLLFDLYTFSVRKLWAEDSNQEVSANAEINSMEEAISKAG